MILLPPWYDDSVHLLRSSLTHKGHSQGGTLADHRGRTFSGEHREMCTVRASCSSSSFWNIWYQVGLPTMLAGTPHTSAGKGLFERTFLPRRGQKKWHSPCVCGNLRSMPLLGIWVSAMIAGLRPVWNMTGLDLHAGAVNNCTFEGVRGFLLPQAADGSNIPELLLNSA